MKPLAPVALIFLTGFTTLSALTDKCEENNLNTLMVHFRKLHTDFKQFKENYETQKNASLKELRALQNMTDQLKEQTVELNEKLQNMTERLTELKVEKQATPLVSFVVRLAEEHNCTEKVPFGLVLLNEGNGFDNTSNSFKAPYSGVYSLTVQLCTYDYSYLEFSVHSQTYNKTYGASFGGAGYFYSYDCMSLTTVAKLASDEEVYVHVDCSYNNQIVGHTDENFWTMFSGILIHLSP